MCVSEDDSEIELITLSHYENISCTSIELNEHTVPSDSIAQLVERWTGVPEGASSNPAQVNVFFCR